MNEHHFSADKSQYLHALRWASALLVVIAHVHRIGGGTDSAWFRFLASHAHAAVMVFFVLSGYVIAATIDRKGGTRYPLRDYFLDRAARIYTVLIPAIVLTVLLDFTGRHFFPIRYSDPAWIPQDHFLVRFLINVFCLQGIWGFRVQFGSNPALWSVGYEFCYYIFYGLWVWRPHRWKILFALLAAIIGPKVLAYGLVWLMGVLAFRLNKQGWRIPTWLALPVFLLANWFLQYHPWVDWPELARDLAFAVATTGLIMATPKWPAGLQALNRHLAEFSFSLYAYHMPLLFLAYSWAPKSLATSWLMVVGSVLAARILYIGTEAQRTVLRDKRTH